MRCRQLLSGIQTFKEPIMKRTFFLNRSLFAALLLSASASVFAGAPTAAQSGLQPVAAAAPSSDLLLAAIDQPSVPAWTASADSVAAATGQGKTRAQVRAELIQAERDGLIPSGNIHYPPGPDTIARNKLKFQKAKDWWQAHGLKSAWAS
jgi:hypothetical protein